MKPRNSSYFRSQEAPKAEKPEAPFGRPQQKAPASAKPRLRPQKMNSPRPAPPPPKATAPKPQRPNRASRPTPQGAAKPRAPGAMINRRAADRLRDGYLWVYASDIESLNVLNVDHPPALLPVADSRGLLLGTALYSPTSQIALRLVSREALDEPAWL